MQGAKISSFAAGRVIALKLSLGGLELGRSRDATTIATLESLKARTLRDAGKTGLIQACASLGRIRDGIPVVSALDLADWSGRSDANLLMDQSRLRIWL